MMGNIMGDNMFLIDYVMHENSFSLSKKWKLIKIAWSIVADIWRSA